MIVMKKYNRPVVEINGFEVEDIITASIYGGGHDDASAAYNSFVDGNTNNGDRILYYEW
jgi:hypothetical protein